MCDEHKFRTIRDKSVRRHPNSQVLQKVTKFSKTLNTTLVASTALVNIHVILNPIAGNFTLKEIEKLNQSPPRYSTYS